ncbi:6-phosphogluconolactonase, partial [Phenoliferia sp. Uapishka_3]
MSTTLYTSGYGGKIHTLSFTPTTTPPTLTCTSTIPAGTAPTWLLLHPNLPVLYSVDEFSSPTGVLSAYKISQTGGPLELISQTPSGGDGPVHLALSGDKRTMYVANYGGATVASVGIKEDGDFLKEREPMVFKFEGKGPREDRQEAPHPHGVYIDPTVQFLVAADLGTDTLKVWSISNGKMDRLEDFAVKAGSGPRHLSFSIHNQKTLLYLVSELSNEISTFEFVYPTLPLISPKLVSLQLAVSVLPLDRPTPGPWTAAELSLTPSHSHLFISNRSPDDPKPTSDSDVIAVFEIQADGTLKVPHVGLEVKGGRGLRDFRMSPKKQGILGMEEAGKWVAVA